MPNPEAHTISVLVADDDIDQRRLLESVLAAAEWADYRVSTASDGRSALAALRTQVFDVVLLDLSMPGLDGLDVLASIAEDPHRPQVIVVSGTGTVSTATRAMKLGAYDFVEKPVQPERLTALVWKAAQARAALAKSERLGAVLERETARGLEIVTEDPRLRRTLELIDKVAVSDVSVLVVSESGTGKELVAREIHHRSARRGQPLVALNCAAVAESLAESELFGHEKGAFTGAGTRKSGLLELADGGTLFLDEIGDLAPPLQAKLLRVLETKHYRRVGGTKELPTDFRLVSATNRPLDELVAREMFRRDLFYRINAVVLSLPPLRERPGDITLLVRHFLAEFRRADADAWVVTPDAMALLESYAWPGNVRELRNVIERLALLAQGRTIRAVDLGASFTSTPATAVAEPALSLPSLHLDELERLAIREALDRTSWHQGLAAEILGVSPRTLHRKIRTLGLTRPR